MSETKRQSALKQDAYKILCQLKIEELEPRIFQTALSFAIGSGDQHLLIGLMRKYPELIGQDSVFSKAVYESIRLNPDTAESVYLKALANLNQSSKNFANEFAGSYGEIGLAKMIVKKNIDLQFTKMLQKRIEESKFSDYRELSVARAKCENARRQAMQEWSALRDYGDVEKGFIDAAKAFELRSIYSEKSPDRLIDWAYSQMALRDVGITKADIDKMGNMYRCRLAEPNNWGIKYAIIEMKDKNVRNNPYLPRALGDYENKMLLSKREGSEIGMFSDYAYESIYLGRSIRVDYAPNEDGESSDLIG